MTSPRLPELPDGRFSYQMKRPLPGGKTHLTMTGTELLAKLTPLIPPPWSNLTRFHGVFAPGSKLRRLVVPAPEETSPEVRRRAAPARDEQAFVELRRPRRAVDGCAPV